MWGLKELPLPSPVSWVPSTWGWIVIAAILMGLSIWMGKRAIHAWQAQAYRRNAIADLDAMASDQNQITALPALLRRTALLAFPRDEVAALRGNDWVDWLNAAGADFRSEDAAWLDRLAYQPSLSEKIEPDSVHRLLEASRRFVRSHHARL
jgi:hypothetical protein